MPELDKAALEAVVRALYAHPNRRHAVSVDSDDAVGNLRLALEATVTRLHGSDAMWGRGVRIEVERDDDGVPHRAWLWRALVGGQRPMRDGFSSEPRRVRA